MQRKVILKNLKSGLTKIKLTDQMILNPTVNMKDKNHPASALPKKKTLQQELKTKTKICRKWHKITLNLQMSKVLFNMMISNGNLTNKRMHNKQQVITIIRLFLITNMGTTILTMYKETSLPIISQQTLQTHVNQRG